MNSRDGTALVSRRFTVAPGVIVRSLDDCRVAFDTTTGNTHFIRSINALVFDLLASGAFTLAEIEQGLPLDSGETLTEEERLLIGTFLTSASQAGMLATQ
ncbi:MAG: hypothetical protein WC247_03750 [Porticoccaceae bacterium]